MLTLTAGKYTITLCYDEDGDMWVNEHPMLYEYLDLDKGNPEESFIVYYMDTKDLGKFLKWLSEQE